MTCRSLDGGYEYSHHVPARRGCARCDANGEAVLADQLSLARELLTLIIDERWLLGQADRRHMGINRHREIRQFLGSTSNGNDLGGE